MLSDENGNGSESNAKKMSDFRWFLLFEVAKRSAQHLFAPYHHTNICIVTMRMCTPLYALRACYYFRFNCSIET